MEKSRRKTLYTKIQMNETQVKHTKIKTYILLCTVYRNTVTAIFYSNIGAL